MVWMLINAWSLRVTSPDLKAEGKEVAIKSIELA
jgi:hypothetical protein